MQKQDSKKYTLPDEPGVYIFRNAKKQRIYIGKATSLKSRVASYFGDRLMQSRGPLLVRMLEEAVSIEWEQTDSVLEALILEANLIKKYQPLYNSKEKSNKSFNYLVITNEEYPRLLIKRERELIKESVMQETKKNTKEQINMYHAYKKIFGPFPYGTVLKEAMKVVRKIFPYRDTCKLNSKKGCFNYQIGLCPGACIGIINKRNYAKTIQNISMLFQGKKMKLIEQLEKQMRNHAKKEEFEKAATVRNQIYALEHINDIALGEGSNSIKMKNTQRRIEAYDIAHMSEQNRVGVMVVLEDGEPNKNQYRKFKIKTTQPGDIAGLKELLTRRFRHKDDWELPSLIVVDGGKAQINAARKILKEIKLTKNDGHRMSIIPVVGVVKDKRHNPKAIVGNKALGAIHEKEVLLANSEAHRFAIAYHKKIRQKEFL